MNSPVAPEGPTPGQGSFDAFSFDDLPVAVLCIVDGALMAANAEWTSVSGLDGDASSRDGWLTAVHPDDRAPIGEFVVADSSASDDEISVRIVAVDGTSSWFRVHRRCLDQPDVESRLLTLTAIGVHRSNEARLLHNATHDDLTGLANRVRFVGHLERTLSAGTDLAGMLFIDLDHFKTVNDHLGHRSGDDVLRAASRRIESTIRLTDLAGRLGGDEIGVFCPVVSAPEDLFRLAERIGEALATPFSIQNEHVIIDASIGIAFTSATVRTAEALVDAADRAMYAAKAAGGGRWATLTATNDVTPPSALPVDTRPEQLQHALDDRQAMATAVGMISQHLGTNIARSVELLHAYAALSEMTVVAAARVVSERDVGIDDVVSTALDPAARR